MVVKIVWNLLCILVCTPTDKFFSFSNENSEGYWMKSNPIYNFRLHTSLNSQYWHSFYLYICALHRITLFTPWDVHWKVWVYLVKLLIALSAPEVKMRINERGVMSISFPFTCKKIIAFKPLKLFVYIMFDMIMIKLMLILIDWHHIKWNGY